MKRVPVLLGVVLLTAAEAAHDMELYVTGVRYKRAEYTAVLPREGESSVTISPPQTATTEGKPSGLNLTRIGLSFGSSDGGLPSRSLQRFSRIRT